MPRYTHAITAALFVALFAQACSSQKDPSPEPTKPTTTPEPAPEVPAEKTTAEKMTDALAQVASSCEVTLTNEIKNCQGDQLNALTKLITSSDLSYLPALTQAIQSKDANTRRAAAFVFKRGVLSTLAKSDKETLNKDHIRDLLEAIQTLPATVDRTPHDSIGAAIALATAAGMDEEGIAMLSIFDPANSRSHRAVYSKGIESIMIHGRMKHFELVQGAAEIDEAFVQRAAFEAVLRMPNMTEEESAIVCPWAHGYLSKDPDNKWEAKQAAIMLKCTDEDKWRGLLLEDAKARVAAGTYKRPYADVIRYACRKGKDIPEGPKTTCGETHAFLVSVLKNKKLDTDNRMFALSSIAFRWPTKDSLALFKPYEDDKDEALAKRARSTIARVSKTIARMEKIEKERAEIEASRKEDTSKPPNAEKGANKQEPAKP